MKMIIRTTLLLLGLLKVSVYCFGQNQDSVQFSKSFNEIYEKVDILNQYPSKFEGDPIEFNSKVDSILDYYQKESIKRGYDSLVVTTTESILLREFGNKKPSKPEKIRAILYAGLDALAGKEFNTSNLFLKAGNALFYHYPDSALTYYLEGSNIAKSFEDNDQLYYNIVNGAEVYQVIGRTKEAIQQYFRAIRIESISNINRMHINKNLSILYQELNQKSQSLFHAKESVKSYKVDTSIINNEGYIALSSAYLMNNFLDSSKKFANLALALALKSNTPFHLGHAYNQFAEIELKSKKYTKAIDWHNKAEIAYNNAGIKRKTGNLISYGKCLRESGKYKESISILDKAYKQSLEERLTLNTIDVLLEKSTTYVVLNNYRDAYSCMNQAKILQDSFNEKEVIYLLNVMAMDYETEKKDLEISSLHNLNEEEAKRTALQVKIKKIVIWASAFILIGGILITWIVMKKKEKRRVNDLELKLSSINMSLLINRMSPHFIFNTLNSIEAYINKNDPENASKYLLKFSKLMRGFLESISNRVSALEEELKLIKEYLDLEKMRFKNRFTYKIYLGDNVKVTDKFPCMLLQPLVENAVKHGIPQSADLKGFIEIHILKEGDQWVCKVLDNGEGLNDKPKIKKHVSRGMEIIKERMLILSKLSGRRYYFTIKNRENQKGVEASFTAPILST